MTKESSVELSIYDDSGRSEMWLLKSDLLKGCLCEVECIIEIRILIEIEGFAEMSVF